MIDFYLLRRNLKNHEHHTKYQLMKAKTHTIILTIYSAFDKYVLYFQSNAFNGNLVLLEKLVLLANNETYPKYEDYITTCEGDISVLLNLKTSIQYKTTLSLNIMYNTLLMKLEKA